MLPPENPDEIFARKVLHLQCMHACMHAYIHASHIDPSPSSAHACSPARSLSFLSAPYSCFHALNRACPLEMEEGISENITIMSFVCVLQVENLRAQEAKAKIEAEQAEKGVAVGDAFLWKVRVCVRACAYVYTYVFIYIYIC